MVSQISRASASRRRFLKRVGRAALLAPLAGSAVMAQSDRESEKGNPRSLFRAAEFNHLALDTPQREQAIAFYEKVFGMTNISHGRTVRDTFLHFDKGFVNLGQADAAGLNHFCLGIENFERDTVFRMLDVLELKPFLMGGNNLHLYDPDGLNVQIQEIGHGYGRIDPSELTQAKKGLMETTFIHHLSLTVTDVSRSRDFYTEMFGLRVMGEPGPDRCMLGVGTGFLELTKGPQPKMNHFCIAIRDYDASKVITKLDESGINNKTTTNSVISLQDTSGLTVQVTSIPQA